MHTKKLDGTEFLLTDDSRLTVQYIPRLLRNVKVHYSSHNSQVTGPYPEPDESSLFSRTLFKAHFNIILGWKT
jgi:hypothetical protein